VCILYVVVCCVADSSFPGKLGAIWKEAGETVKEMDFLYILIFLRDHTHFSRLLTLRSQI